ncbi:unnamed protein product [Symbiodinium sp. KB8]|nr:unnamed protein product [Symbiodinium sp. KB8]
MEAKENDETRHVVICGGGVIGVSIAYFLSVHHGVSVTIIERHEIAGCASGKAGGFLASDWSEGTTINELVKASYQLHMEFGKKHGHEYGFRTLMTSQVLIGKAENPKRKSRSCPEWISKEKVAQASNIGNIDTTAQVHPRLFTNFLLKKAKESGARVIFGDIEGISGEDGKFEILYRGSDSSRSTLVGSQVVIAMGPWSPTARKWMEGLQLPPITGTRAHSIVMRPNTEIEPTAVFVEYESDSVEISPEVYPRPDGKEMYCQEDSRLRDVAGTVYMCGATDKKPLPEHPKDVEVSKESGDTLVKAFKGFSPLLEGSSIDTVQACYLPYSRDHEMPLVSAFFTLLLQGIAFGEF